MRLSVLLRPLRRLRCTSRAAGICFLLALSAPAWGWGPLGHRIIARIAEKEAGSKALSRLNLYLGKDVAIEDAVLWADTLEVERPETARWHFIHIPPNAMELDLDRVCPDRDCVTVKVREFEGIARLGIRDRSEIEEAVKLVLHLMGDLHQPLHAGYAEDEEGRGIPVVLDGRAMSLYDAWDSALVARLGDDDAAIAERLEQNITSEQRRQWQAGNLRDWTWETHLLAARMAYGALPTGSPKTLGDDYVAQATEVVETQLMKAGVRLAKILDRIWP
jgi:nuclease S1